MWRNIDVIIYFLLILLLPVNPKLSAIYGDETQLPLWTWDCVNERCVPSRAENPLKLQSLYTCNMLCSPMQLWPQPTGTVNLLSVAVSIRADHFKLRSASAPTQDVHDHIVQAFELFRQDLLKIGRRAQGIGDWRAVDLYVTVVGDGDPRMTITTDESYELRVYVISTTLALHADINAKSFCGAVRALETLLQLIWYDPYLGSLMILSKAEVFDSPKFSYRGLMLDTARTFYPMSDLMRMIDAMAACKFNTFHWHISDSQSFPLKMRSTSQISSDEYESYDKYTTMDMYNLVQRAKLRGIRVLIEIDAPAHVGYEWKVANKTNTESDDVVYCLEDNPSESGSTYCTDPPCGHLNPKNTKVFDILESIYEDIITITEVDDMFHIGGSEISTQCWEDNIKGARDHSIELWLGFMRHALRRLHLANGHLPNITIFWSSQLAEYLKTDLRSYAHALCLQMFKSDFNLNYMQGIRIIISNEEKWDLNSGLGVWYEEVSNMPYNTWQKIYEHRPWVGARTPGIVLGGEGTMWSHAAVASELDGRLWPRAAALAERLWSDIAQGATKVVQGRLDLHRSRMLARGINATPLWSMWCSHNSHTCD